MEKKIVFAFLYILLFPVLLLLLSGDFTWPEGWIFSIWFIILCFSTILYLYRKDPALLEERYKQPGHGNQEPWDRYVVYGLVVGFILWIVIMPLDAKRFGLSPVFPLWLKVLGGALLAGSFFLFFRSYADNTFLSPLVRIQEDRKQRVVSDRGIWICPASYVPWGDPDVFRSTPDAGFVVRFACRFYPDPSPYGKDTGGRSDACPGPGRLPGIYEEGPLAPLSISLVEEIVKKRNFSCPLLTKSFLSLNRMNHICPR